MRTSDAARLLQALALLVLAVAAMVAALRLPVYGWDGKTRFHRVTGELEVAGEEGWRSLPTPRPALAPEEAAERAARETYARHCEHFRLEGSTPMPAEQALENLKRWIADGGGECAQLLVELDLLRVAERKREAQQALAELELWRSAHQERAPLAAEP